MSKQNYDASLETLEAIPPEEVRTPNVPVDVYVQEAHNLEVQVKDDEELMTQAGMDWNHVLNLPVRAGALRYAQSVWLKDRYNQEEARQEWETQYPEAMELKNDLEDTFRFAFRKRPDLLNKVKLIEEGSSHADMVQDLSDLSVLGKANEGLLTGVGMDMGLLDVAETKSAEMAHLLALMNGERTDNSNAKIMRDRAFTLLKASVDEVRATGKYVFRNDPQRLKGFYSAYQRKLNKRRSE